MTENDSVIIKRSPEYMVSLLEKYFELESQEEIAKSSLAAYLKAKEEHAQRA